MTTLLSSALRMQGKTAEAEPLLMDVIPVLLRRYSSDHPDVVQAIRGLVQTLISEGRTVEAQAWNNRLPTEKRYRSPTFTNGTTGIGL